MATLEIFAKNMNQLAANVQSRVPALLKEISINIVDDVATANPVLTGQSSSNWKTAIGAPDLTYDMGPNARAGQQSVDDAKAALSALAMGQTVYISNSVPYIIELNNGSSAKAPAGFVEMAIVSSLQRTGNFDLLIK